MRGKLKIYHSKPVGGIYYDDFGGNGIGNKGVGPKGMKEIMNMARVRNSLSSLTGSKFIYNRNFRRTQYVYP